MGIQALHAILGDSTEKTNVTLLYGSLTSKDILAQEMLDDWSEKYDNFTLKHVLSNEEENSKFQGARGFINKILIQETIPGPDKGDEVMIFVCGPPPMYNALCGPRDESEISGLLADMGYSKDQVYK